MKRIFQFLFMASVTMACKPDYNTSVEKTQESVRAVKVMALEANEQPIPIHGIGTLASQKEMLLSFKTGGFISKIYAEEGERVAKGQTLATLNKTEINARVAQAEQNVAKLNRDLARVKSLLADSVATLEQFQDLSTALEVAKADVDIARFNQQYSEIKAPSSGKILKKMTEENELIQPGTPVFLIGANKNNNAYKLKIEVADREILQIQLGDSATVDFDAIPTQSFKAFVTEVAEAANPRTGTFEVELTLQSTELPLKNGFIGKVNIFPSAQEKFYKVPMVALVGGEGHTVKLLVTQENEAKAKMIEVKAMHLGKDFITINQNDWNTDYLLITEGAAYTQVGEAVKILNRTEGMARK